MSSTQKHSLTGFARAIFVLIPLLLGCSFFDSFSPAPSAPTPLPKPTPMAQVVSQPAPPLKAALPTHPAQRGPLPDRLQIPNIRVDTPVVALGWSTTQNDNGRIFSEWEVADNAAGWHKNSALLGEQGNLVMSGHNNIKGAVFRNLDQLKRGDKAIIWSGKQHFDYQVSDVMIVPEKYASIQQRLANAKWIGPFDDQRLTLVSCWPRDDNTHRIIVIAYPVKKQ